MPGWNQPYCLTPADFSSRIVPAMRAVTPALQAFCSEDSRQFAGLDRSRADLFLIIRDGPAAHPDSRAFLRVGSRLASPAVSRRRQGRREPGGAPAPAAGSPLKKRAIRLEPSGPARGTGSVERDNALLQRAIRRLEPILGATWVLPAVLAAGALLRSGNLLALAGSPYWTMLQLDHRAYDDWGLRIAQGEWLGREVFFVDPLYAYFLGGLYAIFGHSLVLVRVVQMLLGLATCWLAARIGRRVFDSSALGNLAALLVAFYIPAVHYESAIEKTALGVFLSTLALYLYLGTSLRDAVSSGVTLGFAALARGNMVLLIPFGAAALLGGSAPQPMRRRRAAFFAAGACAVLAVVAARNVAVSGELILTTANLGQNLYIGQQRASELGTYEPPAFVRPDPRHEEADFRAEAERRMGSKLAAGQVSTFWLLRAIDEMAAAPGAALLRTWSKLRLFFHRHEVPDNDNIELVAYYSPVLRIPVLWMGTLFSFALLGAAVSWTSRPVRMLAATVAFYCAGVVAFFVLGRFRAPIVPALAVLAAAAIAWLYETARTAAWRKFVAGAALVVAAGVWTHVRPGWLESRRRSGLAIAYHNLGSALIEMGDVAGGIDAYERAVASSPQSVIVSMRALGDLYLARRDYGRAERYMRRVLEIKPGSRLGQTALVRLYEAMLRAPDAKGDPATKRKLAAAYRAVGRGADAERLLSGADLTGN